ncbi:MAG: GldG family protein [Saprospiraceae bacterium]|nr:Gldg family protein [Lewinella sp.]
MKNTISILLLIGIVILLNLLGNDYFFRWDLTEDNQYTLSDATRNILRDLEDPVTIKAYFSADLPTDLVKTRNDFRDMLKEYATISRGMVDYEFISPEEDADKQAAAQAGIQPVMINVREKDQMKQQQAFMGATIEMGEQQEVIPFIQPGAAMEYALSTSIKKVSVADKPSVGLIQGHGEPGFNQLAQVYESLGILYEVETVNLASEPTIADRFRAVAIIAPTDTIPADQLAKLDDYLARGGKLLLALNAVAGDLSTAQGTAVHTGLGNWLMNKGIQLQHTFLIDASCGQVSVQQQQVFFTFQTPVQFPFIPIINTFADHPITKGLEQVLLPFASPLNWLGDSSRQFTPLAFSSSQSGTINPPTMFDVSRQWQSSDFPNSALVAAAAVEGTFGSTIPTQMVVIGDGDFAVAGQGQMQSADNISLLVNSIDWLSDDTGLIELRTKGVASRPIDQEYLADEAEGTRNWYKYLNFGLPILLVVLYGIFRSQRQRTIRLKRMQERF